MLLFRDFGDSSVCGIRTVHHFASMRGLNGQLVPRQEVIWPEFINSQRICYEIGESALVWSKKGP